MYGKITPRVIWEQGHDRIVFSVVNNYATVHAESSRRNAMGDSVWAPQDNSDEALVMYKTLLIDLARKGAV
jgi:hypothetical protein